MQIFTTDHLAKSESKQLIKKQMSRAIMSSVYKCTNKDGETCQVYKNNIYIISQIVVITRLSFGRYFP